MSRLLLASNVGYWPSTGGSEMVVQNILEGVRHDFDRVTIFVPGIHQPFSHNGVEVRPYSWIGMIRFAIKHQPAIYFPNMVHSKITLLTLGPVSLLCGRTVINLVGGYRPDTPRWFRWLALKNVEWFADCAVEVDEKSVEFLTDRATNRKIKYQFISQGLHQKELSQYIVPWPRSAEYFVFAQNLWDWKRPDLFIHDIASQLPSLQFRIIASDTTGNYISQTRQLAQGAANVEMLLGLDRPEFLRQLAGSSGVINTSKVEGAQPNVLLEAGFLGVPYFSLCPNQDFSHYPHAEMFNDAEALRSRLLQLHGRVHDRKKNQLEQAMQMFGDPKYDWTAVISEFNRLFVLA
jgi:hypothetical protein